MKRVFLFLFFISSLHYSHAQIKEVSLVFKTNLAKLHYEYATPQVGFEIGNNLKFSLLKNFDLVTGGSFRFVRYGISLKSTPDVLNHSEQLFHFKVPIELSYRITPDRWRTHLGVWSSILLAGNLNGDNDFLLTSVNNERTFFSTVYFGANVGFSYSFPKGFEVLIDYSYSINNIYQKGVKRSGLDIFSLGILIPIKK
jgi:hypothetical protein